MGVPVDETELPPDWVEEQDSVFGASEPTFLDKAWLDTVVVLGLTCFILCLMGLSKVRKEKQGAKRKRKRQRRAELACQ